MPVRSAVLAAMHITTVGETRLTICPAGYTLLVKSIYLTNLAGTGGGINVSLENAAGVRAYIFSLTATAGQLMSWEGWAVLEQGNALQLATAMAPVDAWVSGTVLSGVPIDTPPAVLLSPLPA